MDYKKSFMAASVFGLFVATSTFAQTAEIADWSGFRKGAASFTFDDGAPSHVSDGGPLFDKYGYKATFNLVTKWNPDWSGFGNLAQNGHEIASHSVNHGNPMGNDEIASSKGIINGQIQQKYGLVTLAYPNCTVPNEGMVLQNYIVGRICNGSWKGFDDDMSKDGPRNWAQVPAIMTGAEGTLKSTNDFTGKMQSAVQNNRWVAFLTHGFQYKNNGSATYSPTDIGAIEGALKWAKDNDKDIWVAPMGHVAMYIKERKSSKIEEQDGGSANSKSFTLKHEIADDISKYDYPLSIRVKTDWTNVEVTQDNAKLESKVDGGYVYFDAVPNAGNIVVKNAAAIESSSSSEIESSSSENPEGIIDMPNTFQHAVYASNGYIAVSGSQGETVTVFNSLGHKLRTTRILGCEQKVYTGAKGVYIVKVGRQTFKVKL